MELDYDDPTIEKQWCAERQAEVADYLRHEAVTYGRVGEWPAWHLAPYISVWAVESASRPNWLGFWVLCGDLPTDYVSAETIKHPRDAIRAIAQRWLEASSVMAQGKRPEFLNVGAIEDAKELAPMLESRASLLMDWVNDEELWEDE